MRIAKRADPRRLAALKVRIHNEVYLARALAKIALILTDRLVA
mgnify:CR=1 FL=1|jgi:hypothetical protein